MQKRNRKVWYAALLFIGLVSFTVLSNPNCPTGYTTAPGLNSTTTRNCTSCHGDYALNTAGGGITVTGLPSTFTAGTAYPFTIKINHSAANRTIWGFSIKAVDTLTHAVIGTWATTNTRASIKGTAGGSTYELSHASAATSTAANTYTYTGLTWTAPAAPTAVQSRVKFYVAAVAGNNDGNEAGDYVYTTSLTANQQVAPTPCTFTYGAWTTCANGIQTRTYTASPAGCTGTPPADSIQRTCTVPVTLPTAVTITAATVPGVCDTLRTFTVPAQSGVNYAWAITGTGNSIVNGQGTNTITAVTKAAGTAVVTLSNTAGSIPSSSTAFTRALPPTPTAINGSIAPCPGSSFTYTLTNPTPSATQATAVVYRWTIPANCTISSATSDSTTVTVSFGTAFNGGAITAKGQTACAVVGAAKSITVAPPKPADIVSSTGYWNACIGNTVLYAVVGAVPVTTQPTGTLYRWTKPAFTTIVSANADSSVISLQFNTGFKGGALKVQSSTSCGAVGVAASKTLTHIGCAPGTRPGVEELATNLASIYPNPSNGTFNILIQTDDKLTPTATIQIYDLTNRLVASYIVPNNSGVLSKTIENTTLKSGFYILTYTVGKNKNGLKLLIQK